MGESCTIGDSVFFESLWQNDQFTLFHIAGLPAVGMPKISRWQAMTGSQPSLEDTFYNQIPRIGPAKIHFCLTPIFHKSLKSVFDLPNVAWAILQKLLVPYPHL